MKNNLSILLTIALFGALGTGCAAHDSREAPTEESEADVLPEALLAEVSPESGMSIRFYEDPDGGIGVLATAAPGVTLPDMLRERMDPVALYEALTGSDAPRALVDASERAEVVAALYASEPAAEEAPVVVDVSDNTVADADAGDLAGLALDDSKLVAHDGNHTASEFIAGHCSVWSNPVYTDCKTNRVCADGSSSCTLYERKSNGLLAIVNPYRGDLRLKIYHTNVWGNYALQYSLSVLEGHTVTKYDNITWKRYQKVTLTEAGGDGFHFNIEAND